jgi:hypothetical protein
MSGGMRTRSTSAPTDPALDVVVPCLIWLHDWESMSAVSCLLLLVT